MAASLAAGLCVSTAALAEDNLLDRMFGKPSEVGGPQSSGQQATPEQVMRIERLEAQIRQMTGTIEQLQYRNQQLENQIRAMGGQVAGQPGQPGVPPMQQGRSMAAVGSTQPPPPPMSAPPPMGAPQMVPPAPVSGGLDAAPMSSIRRSTPMRPARRVRSVVRRTSRRRSSPRMSRSARPVADQPAGRSI